MRKLRTAALAALALPLASFADGEKVFAHYMTCFCEGSEYSLREIRLAQRYGIEGFALNCGEWRKYDSKAVFQPTHYVRNADAIFAAAQTNAAGFKLFMSPDFAGKMIKSLPALNIGDMVRRYYSHPNSFRYKGKYFLSGWAGHVEMYRTPKRMLELEGFDVCLVPYPSVLPNHPMTWTVETTRRQLVGEGNALDGIFRFAADSTLDEHLFSNSQARRATLMLDKLYMASACPAYNSSNLREFYGVWGYLKQWEGFVEDGADFTELVTWNDYNEDSNLMPGFFNATARLSFSRDESYLDATLWGSEFFRKGVRPAIPQDRIYVTHRTRPVSDQRVWSVASNCWMNVVTKPGVRDQLHDDVSDTVYVTTMLTAPATIRISQGDDSREFSAPAGVGLVHAPMRFGSTPRITLSRGGKTLIDTLSRRFAPAEPDKRYHSGVNHGMNRTWTNGAAAGDESFAFDASSKLIANPGDKIECPFSTGGKDSSFAWRITYRNPSSSEARFTFRGDGAPGESRHPWFIPVWLPPTGGEPRTASFLFSMWDKTTKISLERVAFDPDKKTGAPNPNDDYGSAEILRIAAVPLAPFSANPPPRSFGGEFVAIPGTDFEMGKYEVTNEEYERFDPKHKILRDEFSFRNREPVIYVAQKHALAYAEWLTQNANDGFVYSLPTAAEWERAATAGENRAYPWGAEPPSPARGNFLPAKPSFASAGATVSGRRTAVVGSFPAGASKDGIMDLAGNVAEWTSDDFCPGYKTIMGSSWGYYASDVRSSRREYNTDRYPGFPYVGIRLIRRKAK